MLRKNQQMNNYNAQKKNNKTEKNKLKKLLVKFNKVTNQKILSNKYKKQLKV